MSDKAAKLLCRLVKSAFRRSRAELLYGLARKPEATRLAELVHAFLSRVRSLVTGNVRHFRRIPGLEVLDWV